MKFTDKQSVLCLIEMIAFCAVMLYGMIYGPKHPQIFFWSMMAVFASVVLTMIKPTLKDTIILIVGMIIMSIAGAGINKLVLYFSLKNTLPGFLLSLLLLAPFYFPVALHFVKMCIKQDEK